MTEYDHLEGFQILEGRIKLNAEKIKLVFDRIGGLEEYMTKNGAVDHAYLKGRLDIICDLIRSKFGALDHDGEITVEAVHPDVKALMEGRFGGEDF